MSKKLDAIDRIMFRDAFDKPSLPDFKDIIKENSKIDENKEVNIRYIIKKQHPEYTDEQVEECVNETLEEVKKEFPELFE